MSARLFVVRAEVVVGPGVRLSPGTVVQLNPRGSEHPFYLHIAADIDEHAFIEALGSGEIERLDTQDARPPLRLI